MNPALKANITISTLSAIVAAMVTWWLTGGRGYALAAFWLTAAVVCVGVAIVQVEGKDNPTW